MSVYEATNSPLVVSECLTTHRIFFVRSKSKINEWKWEPMNSQSCEVLVLSETCVWKDYFYFVISDTRMCILFFHIDASPDSNGYKLILASNRDEFYARPTAKAHAWEDNPWIFGGLFENFQDFLWCFLFPGYDLQPGKEGGTWLGLSAKDGVLKFGAILNITGEAHSADFLGELIIWFRFIKKVVNNFRRTLRYLHS